jgi:hypothetical protein
MPSVGATPNTFGNIGLLGQINAPAAPSLSGAWNAKTGKFDLSAVLKQLQQSQDQANQGNVTRYNNLLTSISGLGNQVTGGGGTYQQALGLLDNAGQAATTRIGQGVQQQTAANQQNLTSRGLGNTTIGVNLDQQARQQGEQAQQTSDEAVAGQKAGVLQNLAGAQMNIGGMQQRGIESLNQQAPNMQLYSDMIKQYSSDQAQAAKTAAAQQTANQASVDATSAAIQRGFDAYTARNAAGGGGGGASFGSGSSQGGGGGSGNGASVPGTVSGPSYLTGGSYGGTGNSPGATMATSQPAGGMGGMGQQYPYLAGAARPQEPIDGAGDFSAEQAMTDSGVMPTPAGGDFSAEQASTDAGVAPTPAAVNAPSASPVYQTYDEYYKAVKARPYDPAHPYAQLPYSEYYWNATGGR